MSNKIWTLVDGVYVSIPTDLPEEWRRRSSGLGVTLYESGEYVITRKPRGMIGYSFQVTRQGLNLFGSHDNLKDAQNQALKNARGEDRVS